jgi:hypothetical protein
MEPSLIHLETPEDVQLAYAQAASAIEFVLITHGHLTLREMMNRMARSTTEGAGESIKETLKIQFSEFEKNGGSLCLQEIGALSSLRSIASR